MTDETLINELNRQNPWWESGQVMPEDVSWQKRDAFETIKKRMLANELITAVTGLRRIGKTVLIRQLMNDLIQDGINRKRVVFFSFDDSSFSQNKESLEKIIEFVHDRFPKEKIYFFFDEIQSVDFWNPVLKRYFDYGWPIKFIITGSSSLFLKTTARESLAGRILEYHLQPLSYGEYLRFFCNVNVPEMTPFSFFDSQTYEEDLEKNLYDYLTFGEFPFLPKMQEITEQREYVLEWVVGKIVQSDLPKLKKRVNLTSLLRLANVLIEGSGQVVELQNLASDLAIDQKTITQYLYLLEETKLIRQFFNLGSGFRTRSLRQRKIYCASVNAVVLNMSKMTASNPFDLKAGPIVETFVANYLAKQEGQVYIWRERQKEVDFIWERGTEKIPVEVKFQSQIHKNDLKNIITLCKKRGLKEGIVVTKNKTDEEIFDEVKLKFIPAYYLC